MKTLNKIKIVGPSHVISETFEYKRISKDFSLYIEGEKELKIYTEAGYDPNHYVGLALSSVEFWTIPSGQKIDVDQKEDIKNNIRMCFQAIGTRLTFD